MDFLSRPQRSAHGWLRRPAGRDRTEVGFGWVLGDALDEPVLLVKCAWGGKSLAVDFRPPSAGKPPYSLGEKADAEIAQDPTIVGRYYRETVCW